jgi:PAS domain S-box-containing protein
VEAGQAVDLPFVARDGSPRRARLRASPIGAAGEGIVLIDGGAVDRAEFERADLFESHLLQTIIDAIPTPIWFKTIDGIYRGCNVAFEQALGKTRSELIGRGVEAAGPSRITSVYRNADRALFESGGTQFYEGELLRADGAVRRVSFHKAAFRDHTGTVVGIAGALTDITDLRRTEEELRSALAEQQKAEEAARRADRLASLGTLAAGVAHELANPLSFVLANAEFALERLRRDGPPGAPADPLLSALADVVQGARRMRVIVSDLRTAARGETGGEPAVPVDLRRVVDYAVQLTAAELRRRARLELDLQPASPVLGSETRLGQVLVNLLVNAVHAMPDGPEGRNAIRISLRDAPGRRVALSVRDNGCGIPEPIRARIFEPFYSTKPPGEGTGLGLWVCQGIVVDLGGQIEVESAPGEGTTFRVLLPALRPEASEAPRAGAP